MSDDPRWLDVARHVTWLVRGLYVTCGLAFLADLFYAKDGHFPVEQWFGFYAAFGFVVSVLLVLTAKQLRRVLRRDEDYYEPVDEGRDDE